MCMRRVKVDAMKVKKIETGPGLGKGPKWVLRIKRRLSVLGLSGLASFASLTLPISDRKVTEALQTVPGCFMRVMVVVEASFVTGDGRG